MSISDKRLFYAPFYRNLVFTESLCYNATVLSVVSIKPIFMKANISRRKFLRSGTAATAFGLAALQTTTSKAQIIGANERIRLGFVGVAMRGSQLLGAFMNHKDMEVAALCDVDATILNRVHEQYEKKPFISNDFRKLNERKDLDGIVLASPDHWHAIQTIEACKAGKDVYVEKPLSITVVEGRKMVEAARKYNRVVQVGIHRRSGEIYRNLAEKDIDDFIGKVTVARCCHMSNMYPAGIGKSQPANPPEGLDWDLWLGPRAEHAFQPNIHPYKFRWWLDYSSQVTGNGVHFVDLFRHFLKEKMSTDVCAMGGNFAVKDDRTIPDTMHVTWQFDSGRLLEFSHYEANANPIMTDHAFVEFRGTKGTLYVNDDRYLVKPEKPGQFQEKGERMQEILVTSGETGRQQNLSITALHARNFLDCMKSREMPNSDVEEGHLSTTMCIIANISLAVQQRLKWDAENERFIGNEQANALLHYEYRAPWKLEV